LSVCALALLACPPAATHGTQKKTSEAGELEVASSGNEACGGVPRGPQTAADLADAVKSAAISAQSAGERSSSLQAALRERLLTTAGTGNVAYDFVLLKYYACMQCLTLLWAQTDCMKMERAVLTVYKDMKATQQIESHGTVALTLSSISGEYVLKEKSQPAETWIDLALRAKYVLFITPSTAAPNTGSYSEIITTKRQTIYLVDPNGQKSVVAKESENESRLEMKGDLLLESNVLLFKCRLTRDDDPAFKTYDWVACRSSEPSKRIITILDGPPRTMILTDESGDSEVWQRKY